MFARRFSREDLQTDKGIGGLVRTILGLSGLNSVVSGQRGETGGMLMSGPNEQVRVARPVDDSHTTIANDSAVPHHRGKSVWRCRVLFIGLWNPSRLVSPQQIPSTLPFLFRRFHCSMPACCCVPLLPSSQAPRPFSLSSSLFWLAKRQPIVTVCLTRRPEPRIANEFMRAYY